MQPSLLVPARGNVTILSPSHASLAEPLPHPLVEPYWQETS